MPNRTGARPTGARRRLPAAAAALVAACAAVGLPPARSQEPAGPAAPPRAAWRALPVPESENEYRCPVQGGATIGQGNFGGYSHQLTFAWDYTIPIGTPVVAARSGVVIASRTDSNIGGGDPRFEKDANEVRVKHSDGTIAVYGHLGKDASLVREGEFVLQGEIIATSGNSGFSTGPHLHYEVVKDDRTVSTSFADFTRTRGIPQEGDRHGPAAPPAVPQAAIAALKRLHRAAVVAETRGWPEIGLRILEDVPSGKNLGDYYYSRVIHSQRTAFRAAVEAEAARLTGAPVAAFADALLVKRFQVALKPVAETRPLLSTLAEKERTFPDPLKAAFAGAGGALTALVEGMVQECFDEIYTAGGKYMACHKAARGELREESLRCVRRLIDLYLNRAITELIRLKDEAERSLPEHHSVIRADGERVWKLCASLFGYMRDYFPDKKKDHDRDAKVVEYFYERIRKMTQ